MTAGDSDLLPVADGGLTLGPDGPAIGSVAWGMWRYAGVGDDLALRLVETALDAGVLLFDTADIYGVDTPAGFGSAEALLGRVLARSPGLRSRLVLATKGGIRPGTPYDSGPAYLSAAIDASLRRLGVDHVELYQIHRRDMLTHPAQVARTLEDAHRAGKIGAVGVSNYSAAETGALATFLSLPIVSCQSEFSPLHLDPLVDGLFDHAMAGKRLFLAWSPLGGGRIGTPGNAREAAVARLLDDMAAANGVSRAAAAFSWIMAHPLHPMPIVGSQTPDRVAEIAGLTGLRWTRRQWYAVLIASRGEALP